MATHSAAAVATSASSWAKRKADFKPAYANAPAIASTFNPSAQQQSFFEWIAFGDGSLILEACAGSGKTTTLVEGVSRMQGRVFFGAYNKKIADELQKRVPQSFNVKVATMHSAGYAALKQIAPNATLDYNKMRDIYRGIAGYDKQLKGLEALILDLVSFAKQAAIGIVCSIDDKDAWFEVADQFGMDLSGEEDVILFNAIKTLKRSNELCLTAIDFEDMIYYPLLMKAVNAQYDWVLVDEAQDTNATRRLLALALLKKNGRMVAVGDRSQAIYAFTGADHNSLDLIQSYTSASLMPLSVSYRCPKAVVAEAKKYAHHIEAHEDAPEGIVRYASMSNIFDEVKKGDAVLCRYNAPLVELAYYLILKGMPAKIEGKDIGANLKSLAKKWKSPATLYDFKKKLNEYCVKSVNKFVADKKEYLAEALKDKVSCLEIVIDRLLMKGSKGNPSELLVTEIDAIFGETINGDSSTYILLSSIHKAKGLEFKKVIWLTNKPGKRKLKDWEISSETNLKYVAITRAMYELVMIPLPDKTKPNPEASSPLAVAAHDIFEGDE